MAAAPAMQLTDIVGGKGDLIGGIFGCGELLEVLPRELVAAMIQFGGEFRMSLNRAREDAAVRNAVGLGLAEIRVAEKERGTGSGRCGIAHFVGFPVRADSIVHCIEGKADLVTATQSNKGIFSSGGCLCGQQGNLLKSRFQFLPGGSRGAAIFCENTKITSLGSGGLEFRCYGGFGGFQGFVLFIDESELVAGKSEFIGNRLE